MRRIGLNRCPYCSGFVVYDSSAKTFWEKLLPVVLLRLVRCDDCRRRHLRPLFLPALKRTVQPLAPKKPSRLASDDGQKERHA